MIATKSQVNIDAKIQSIKQNSGMNSPFNKNINNSGDGVKSL